MEPMDSPGGEVRFITRSVRGSQLKLELKTPTAVKLDVNGLTSCTPEQSGHFLNERTICVFKPNFVVKISILDSSLKSCVVEISASIIDK